MSVTTTERCQCGKPVVAQVPVDMRARYAVLAPLCQDCIDEMVRSAPIDLAGKTLRQVFGELERRLDVLLCDQCGHERPRRHTKKGSDWGGDKCKQCGQGTYEALIDEYFNGPDMGEGDKPVPPDFRWAACYPVTGGSEGHYIHVEFWSPAKKVTIAKPGTDFETIEVDVSRKGLWRVTRLALGKTFRGMDHAAEIARRCATILGA